MAWKKATCWLAKQIKIDRENIGEYIQDDSEMNNRDAAVTEGLLGGLVV